MDIVGITFSQMEIFDNPFNMDFFYNTPNIMEDKD